MLSDIYMPDLGGLELVDALRAADPNLPIVLMTAQGSLQVAVEAVTRGASDFIGKPFDISGRGGPAAAPAGCAARGRCGARRRSRTCRLQQAGLVGRSAPMIVVFKLIAQAARTDATVLILGESGTGKELVARAIHDFSARRTRPFLSVNCSGLTDTLLEAELFGHTRGAFTGRHRRARGTLRSGRWRHAVPGRAGLHQSRRFSRACCACCRAAKCGAWGPRRSRRVNVRVIGASNAPLRDLVAAGSFRADLYYRLSVLSIELPPLRERAGDIELLTGHFLQTAREPGAPPLHLTREAAEALAAHNFPGNVRELENALRRAVALSSGGLVTIDCLPPEIGVRRAKAPAAERPETAPDRRPSHHGGTSAPLLAAYPGRDRVEPPPGGCRP